MRVVFLGSPAFAVPSLVSLAEHDNIDVALVVTQPDRPAGRGRRLTPPPVKTAALDLGPPIFQPESLRDEDAVQRLRDASPDLLVVVAYGELLRRNILELAPHGCLNVHPSLLPRYRGAAPIPAAILNGDTRTGVSIIKLVRKLDAGPIVFQSYVDIRPYDTTGTLSELLADKAASMLPDVARLYGDGLLPPIPQDEDRATYTREWTTADARIDWTRPADDIERLIRAANPWPVAWTTLDGDRTRVISASIPATSDPPESTNSPPGTALHDHGVIMVTTGTGLLRLNQVQPAGKRPMAAADWLRGLRVDRVQFGS